MGRTRLINLGIICVFLVAAPCTLPEAAAGDAPYRVVHGWPQLPADFMLGEVSGVAIDSHNHIWVFHREDHPILCFEGDTGKLVASFGDNLSSGGAHGLKVDNHDNVWATDIAHHQVFKFSHDGKLLMTLGAKDVAGLDKSHFNQPTDVVIAPDGTFYVSDGYGNSRVVKFTKDGEYMTEWGKKGKEPGEFDTPHGLALDSQGLVYVADRENWRIQVFEPNGKFLYQWKSDELGRPWRLAVTPDGYIYIVDGGDFAPKPPDRGRILKLDLKGRILEKWGTYGNQDGQICWGHDIAVAKNGDLYVTDIKGRRVQKFVRR